MNKTSMCAIGMALIIQVTLTANAVSLKGTKPNIIIVMPDDISWGSMSRYGGEVKTPHLDGLFEKGRRFMNFHVSPTCAPSRASLMTGRHEFYSGITHTIFLRDEMNKKVFVLPEMLKKEGYSTCMVGKWHLGDGKEYRPKARGFDEVLQHGAGGIGQNFDHSADFPGNDYNDPTLLHNEKVIKTKGYCTDIFFDHALKWMDKQKKPFFLYIPTNVVHGPQTPPAGVEVKNKDEAKKVIMKNLDDNMGKLITWLEKSGRDKDTLLVYYTDNGARDSKLIGLNGGKGAAREGGLRVPCVFYWKGTIEKGTEIDALCGHVDLWSTCADLAGYIPVSSLTRKPGMDRVCSPSWQGNPKRSPSFSWVIRLAGKERLKRPSITKHPSRMSSTSFTIKKQITIYSLISMLILGKRTT